jgi:hypothetical protein
MNQTISQPVAQNPTDQSLNQSTQSGEVETRAFYFACIDHLLRLDTIIGKFQERKPAGSPTEGIEIARLILVELLDFTEQQFAADEFEQICRSLADVHELTNQVFQQLQASSWSVFRRAKSDATDGTDKLDYAGLGQQYCKLMAEYYVNCVKKFTCSEAEKKTFLMGAEALIHELGARW